MKIYLQAIKYKKMNKVFFTLNVKVNILRIYLLIYVHT